MIEKTVSCILLIFAFCTDMSAQLIDNRLGNAFEDEMFFNASFITNNQIREIRGESYVKRTNERMKSLPSEAIYHFESGGNLTKLYKVRKLFGKLDTLHIRWDYDSDGKIEQRIETDTRGFYAVDNEWNESGRIAERNFYRMRNKSADKRHFEPLEKYLVNSENYQYQSLSDTVLEKTTFNSYGLPYKKEKTIWNSDGYMLREDLKFVVSGQRQITTYEYNNKGWISYVEVNQEPEGNTTRKSFVYDDMGNLLTIDFFENGEKTHIKELIYTDAMLLHSTIYRELSSNIMNITKYFYTFY